MALARSRLPRSLAASPLCQCLSLMPQSSPLIWPPGGSGIETAWLPLPKPVLDRDFPLTSDSSLKPLLRKHESPALFNTENFSLSTIPSPVEAMLQRLQRYLTDKFASTTDQRCASNGARRLLFSLVLFSRPNAPRDVRHAYGAEMDQCANWTLPLERAAGA